MKLVLGFALAMLFLASCMGQYQVGDRYASLGQTSDQAASHPKVRNQAEELGQVGWGRNLEAAKAKSAQSGKPILLLFQEVPG